jgi:hypothetical protein
MTDYPFGDPTPTYPFGDPVGIPAEFKSDYADAEQRAAANLPLDQWGRYKLPRPDGIQPAVNKGLTRVSTLKSTGQNTDLIQAKTERKIVEGIAADPNLHALAVEALKLPEDSKEQRKAFAAVAQRAFVSAGGNTRRDQGTEVHLLIDAILKGESPEVPEKYRPEIAAYFAALEKHDLTPVPGLSEIVVVCPYEHGGAIDNVMRYWNPDTENYELVVVDTKTGRTLDFSRVEFLSQTWMYSNAYYQFVVTGMDRNDKGAVTTVRGYVQELPLELRQDKAIIIHMPMDGTAEVIELNLSGWDRVVAAQVTIRQANAEAKHRYRSLGIVRPDAFEAPAYPFDVQINGEPATVTEVPVPQLPPVKRDPVTGVVGFVEQTPVQKAQADLAASRLAKVEQMAADRNDDPDDGEPDPVMPLKAAQDAEQVPAPLTHDPVTGRKKRTCGHCHLPGHTQKNCPRNPASVKYDPSVDNPADQTAVDGVPYSRQAAEPDRPIQPDEKQLQKAVPYCLHLGHTCEWTTQFPGKIGEWVCSITGLPGQQAYEAGQTRMTAVSPSFGHPDGAVVQHLAPPVPDGESAAENKPAPPPAWPEADMTSWGITQAKTVQDLLFHRQREIDAGRWNDVYDRQGQARYAVLVQAEQAPPG